MEKQIILTEEEYEECELAKRIFNNTFSLIRSPVYAYNSSGTPVIIRDHNYIQLNLEKLAENIGWSNMLFSFVDKDGVAFSKEYSIETLKEMFLHYDIYGIR